MEWVGENLVLAVVLALAGFILIGACAKKIGEASEKFGGFIDHLTGLLAVLIVIAFGIVKMSEGQFKNLEKRSHGVKTIVTAKPHPPQHR